MATISRFVVPLQHLRRSAGVHVAYLTCLPPDVRSRYYYLPAGLPIFENVHKLNIPTQATREALYIIHEGGKTRTLRKIQDDYEIVGDVTGAVEFIGEPASPGAVIKKYSQWVNVETPAGRGWVDVSDLNVKSYSDADMPEWAGWYIRQRTASATLKSSEST